jgi:two-component system, response regulator YesN
LKIVVVEDEIRSREGIVHLLKRLNPSYYVVGEAGNGRSGLELIKKQQPDLVITDIKMPLMDGLSMLRAVRECGMCTKAIILSAFADFAYAKQAISFGVFEYLLKPVSVGELIESLQKIEAITGNTKTAARDSSISPLIRRVCDFLEAPGGILFSLAEISQRLKVTPEYLGAQFYREMGCHFNLYSKNKRIAYAKLLLKNTDEKVNGISVLCGYQDAKYFSQLFKKEVGVLPVEYRRRDDP